MGAIGAFINVGKVDGSNAWAGTEGEYLSVSNSNPTLAPSVPLASDGQVYTIATLTLPAGDWLVGGQMDAWLDQQPTDWSSVWLALVKDLPDFTTQDVGVNRAYALSNLASQVAPQICLALGPIRVNSPTNSVVTLAIQWFCSQNYPGGADYVIWARRMR